jgi:hypothetical protein
MSSKEYMVVSKNEALVGNRVADESSVNCRNLLKKALDQFVKGLMSEVEFINYGR